MGLGAIAGAHGKDALQDRKEGRVFRAQREQQQNQLLRSLNAPESGQGY